MRRRIVRLVRHHGIDLEQPSNELGGTDERLFECPVYAEIQGAAVAGRVVTGPRAGASVMRVGRDLYAAPITSNGSLHAHVEGFDLHAAVTAPACDRKRLEHLCGYVLRPPIAQDALELTPDGKVLLRLRRPWSDGTRAIRFEPSEFLEKLASMIPRPRVNLLIYHGVFAPHARRRRDAVSEAQRDMHGANRQTAVENAPATPGNPPAEGPQRPPTAAGAEAVPSNGALAPPPPPSGYRRPKHYTWAYLMRRTFEIDVLACPGCGGRLRLLATIVERAVVEKILRHLDLAAEIPIPAAARASPWLPEQLPGFGDPVGCACE